MKCVGDGVCGRGMKGRRHGEGDCSAVVVRLTGYARWHDASLGTEVLVLPLTQKINWNLSKRAAMAMG